MPGTNDGARKSRDTNLTKHGPDFYKKIGSKSWQNPERSRKTGFALLPADQVAAYGRRGGQTNKGRTHAKKENQTAETEPTEGLSPSLSE